MTYEGNGDSSYKRLPETNPHYHGNQVRTIFIFGAGVLLVAESIGVTLPLSSSGAVIVAVVLAVAGGITNPLQTWTHWANEIIAIAGVIVFGTSAVERYRSGTVFDLSFVFIEGIAFLSLVALYFTTRTIRFLLLRPHLK